MPTDPTLEAIVQSSPNLDARAAARIGDLARRVSAMERGGRLPWTTPAFTANFGPFSGWPIDYAKDASSLVMLRGLLSKSAAPVAYETAFTLPAGFRPATNRTFPSFTNAGPSRIQVLTDGRVTLGELPAGIVSGFWWTLDGVSFWAEQ